jgi:hypothetical protein
VAFSSPAAYTTAVVALEPHIARAPGRTSRAPEASASAAVAAGTALGAMARREQDGALLLFIVAGLQFIADPPTLLAHLLPFWSTRELAT